MVLQTDKAERQIGKASDESACAIVSQSFILNVLRQWCAQSDEMNGQRDGREVAFVGIVARIVAAQKELTISWPLRMR